jgi:hypothetical protein
VSNIRRCFVAVIASTIFISIPDRPADAADVGEIALVPDDGTIISQAFWLANFVEHAACAFYRTHDDNYDAIFVWTSAQLNMLTRTQQGWPTYAPAQGIGRDSWFDLRSSFCAHRLRQAVKMSDIDSFADDPDAQYNGAFGFTLTGAQLMGHEFGHQFLAGVTFMGTDGIRHCLIRGFESSGSDSENSGRIPPANSECDGHTNPDFNLHWSYYFNSDSVMYGNHIEDLGGGTFRFTNPSPKYGPLDQYLMGLRDPSEVGPMFLVDVGDVAGASSAAFPLGAQDSAMVSGSRLDFTVQDVIRAEGARMPARDRCHWKAAFIIVHPPNEPPTPQQIARVDRYRQRWETWYDDATDHRGSFDTTLAGTGLGTSSCPATQTPPGDGGPAPDATALDGAADATPGGLDAAEATDSGQPAPADAGTGGPILAEEDGGPFIADGSGVHVLRADSCGCREVAPRRAPLFPWIFAFALAVARRRRPR